MGKEKSNLSFTIAMVALIAIAFFSIQSGISSTGYAVTNPAGRVEARGFQPVIKTGMTLPLFGAPGQNAVATFVKADTSMNQLTFKDTHGTKVFQYSEINENPFGYPVELIYNGMEHAVRFHEGRKELFLSYMAANLPVEDLSVINQQHTFSFLMPASNPAVAQLTKIDTTQKTVEIYILNTGAIMKYAYDPATKSVNMIYGGITYIASVDESGPRLVLEDPKFYPF